MKKTISHPLAERAELLRLHGLLAHWDEIENNPEMLAFSRTLLDWEEREAQERRQRRLLSTTKVGDVEPVSGFDWKWPKSIPRDLIEDLFSLGFLAQKTNVVFLGASGLGKTMLAKNLVHEAARAGHEAMFIPAADLLDELIGEAGRTGVERALKRYAKPRLLAIDEVGYLSYDTRHADLLLRVIQKRHRTSSTIVTTNRPFSEWREMFPNASSVVALMDRLTENCELVHIVGDSYRAHTAKIRREEREATRKSKRRGQRSAVDNPNAAPTAPLTRRKTALWTPRSETIRRKATEIERRLQHPTGLF